MKKICNDKPTGIHIKIGKRAWRPGFSDYAGQHGEITICDKHGLRVQFEGIANNESLKRFNLSNVRFLPLKKKK